MAKQRIVSGIIDSLPGATDHWARPQPPSPLDMIRAS